MELHIFEQNHKVIVLFLANQNQLIFLCIWLVTKLCQTSGEGYRYGGSGKLLVTSLSVLIAFKITVQFESERNGQNEVVSHTDRSEVKL